MGLYQYEYMDIDETLQVMAIFKREDDSFDHAFGVHEAHSWVIDEDSVQVFKFIEELDDWIDITIPLKGKDANFRNLVDSVQEHFNQYEASSADEAYETREADNE